MPCEGCRAQFTVFRLKRTCSECKRYYCWDCLLKSPPKHLCAKCAVFAKRPLLRTDLLKLKPKDLIFYLQSKHISTSGCVEKDELIGLVLNHIEETEGIGNQFNRANQHSESSNSFASLKQSCQNFFSNITDNITDSFSSSKYDGNRRSSTRSPTQEYYMPNGANNNVNNGTTTHIFDQPRVSTREMPSYASYQHQQQQQQQPHQQQSSPTHLNHTSTTATHGGAQSSTTSSAPTSNSRSSATISPIISHNNSIASSQGEEIPEQHSSNSRNIHTNVLITEISGKNNIENAENDDGHSDENDEEDVKSDCECSDDEIIAAFHQRLSTDRDGQDGQDVIDVDNNYDVEMTSQSSFEELGAIGGISDDSKTTTDTNSSNMDQWQILDAHQSNETIEPKDLNKMVNKTEEGNKNSVAASTEKTQQTIANTTSENTAENASNPGETNCTSITTPRENLRLNVVLETNEPHSIMPPPRVKKVTRRRSESYLNRQRRLYSDEESPTYTHLPNPIGSLRNSAGAVINENDDEHSETVVPSTSNRAANVETPSTENRRSRQTHCYRCGKNKPYFKRQIERMRQHLENSQMSEADIKKELAEFLTYLENRTKSMDCSDSETPASSVLSGGVNPTIPTLPFHHLPMMSPTTVESFFQELDDNAGIHVYAMPPEYTQHYNQQYNHQSRFISLNDFDTLEELENLSVKQLKEILTLNRVDYKGCCEKQELLDRVQRLWKNLKSTPAVEKLPTDELCKICMDAPIECVILECGHMATCTNCGKVLSECPICRQYIVRVVRFFRA